MGVIAVDALPRDRWRNGLGVRVGIAAGDGWTLSHAWITDDATFTDFSAFEGLDRTLVLLEGGPLTLVVGEQEVTLAGPGDRQAFAGEAAVRGRPHGGAAHVLNVMTRRRTHRHQVRVGRELPSQGWAVVLAGTVRCDQEVAAPGDTVALPCDVEPSPDLVAVAVTIGPRQG